MSNSYASIFNFTVVCRGNKVDGVLVYVYTGPIYFLISFITRIAPELTEP